MREPLPVTLRLYQWASAAAAPAAPRLLQRRLKRGKEHAARLAERRGEPSLPRPPGPLVWVHGASVGEMLAVIPLIERIRALDFAVLVTSGTVTSAALAEQRLPQGALHQFIPLDAPRFVARFLDHWRPDLALFVESDLWPNLILACTDRTVPMILVNGRLSKRSFSRWRLLPGTIAALLRRFDLCLTQSSADAHAMPSLGAPRVSRDRQSQARRTRPARRRADIRPAEVARRRPRRHRRGLHASRRGERHHRRPSAASRKTPIAVDPDCAAPPGARSGHRGHRAGRGPFRCAALTRRVAEPRCRDLRRRHARRAWPDLPARSDRVHGRLAGAPRRAESDRGSQDGRRRHAWPARLEFRRNLRHARCSAWGRIRRRRRRL